MVTGLLNPSGDAEDPSAPARGRVSVRRTSRGLGLLGVAALGLGSVLVPACGPPTPPRDVNLLLVSVDTLRADRLGCYGNGEWADSPSPVLDELALRSVVFDRAYAPRGQTHPSLASLITGKYPITTGLRENGYPLAESHTTLFEHLATAGYQTGVYIANFEVEHPVDGWIARGAEKRGDGFAGNRRQELKTRPESALQQTWDDRVEQGATAFLRNVDTTRPFALWAHFYDPHKPYNPPAPHVGRYGVSAELEAPLVAPGPNSGNRLEHALMEMTLGKREPTEAELKRIRGLYDATVRATDERLGRLLAVLESVGELEDTYVVFTSDHGEELWDHNRYFFHGSSIYEGVLRLPLVIHGPDLVSGERVEEVVRAIDVTPTVLDLLGLPGDEAMEGVSVAPRLRGEGAMPEVQAVMEWQDLVYAVSDGRYKLVWNDRHVHTRKAPFHAAPPGTGFRIDCLEGYDLQADPGEQNNLLSHLSVHDLRNGDALPPEFRPLYEGLEEFLSDPAHLDGFDTGALGADAVERLKQLGYVSSVSANRGDSTRVGDCP